MSDEALIEEATRAIGDDEPVLAAGVFEPRGAMGGMLGVTAAGLSTDNIVGEVAGAVGGLAAGEVMAHEDDVPRHTLLAVTSDRLYAFGAAAEHGRWVAQARFATFDRSAIAVTVHGRVNVRTLTIEDPASGRTYQWEGNRIGPDHAKAVIEALEAHEVDQPEG
jgi:hypothetical protein